MKFLPFAFAIAASVWPLLAAPPIPEPLKPWEQWAVWDEDHRACPRPFSDSSRTWCFWPQRLELEAGTDGGRFKLTVTVYSETWVPLPGDEGSWPQAVRSLDQPVAVTEQQGRPSVRLLPGMWTLEGAYRWSALPQRIAVPGEIGILSLALNGQPVPAPAWDADGFLWLKRDSAIEEAEKNFLSVKLYASLEDGNPQWLHTEVELTVSGKSREEALGTVLPQGWRLAAVDSPIPFVIDDAGRAKAQVRAGKWSVRADAFRIDNPKEIRYAQDAKPAVAEQFIAFRAKPDFRTVDIIGMPSVDVSQLPFPEPWRGLPVYRWETDRPFRIEERMRGMGTQRPANLSIRRELWLDEDGRTLTFRDFLTGAVQNLWRLDAAPGQDLGSVRSQGQGQLITRNPQSSASGVEIRSRNLNLEATGRSQRGGSMSATGWQADAESLQVTLNLPPGWRLFAVFGADWVRGDWLTAWTLLDLFLLLVFSLAIYRLWGVPAGLLALVAFGLAYHEVGAPRYLWLLLLIPLALQRVVPEGQAQRIVHIGKWVAIGLFVLAFVPFLAWQVQQALYPQLERVSGYAGQGTTGRDESRSYAPGGAISRVVEEVLDARNSSLPSSKIRKLEENMAYDAKARIQTGPGVPEWQWRQVSYGWNGPVSRSQEVRPFLIPLWMERLLSLLRVLLLLALAAVLLGSKQWLAGLRRILSARPGAIPTSLWLVIAALMSVSSQAEAQTQAIPDVATIEKLRERLLKVPDAYPHAADIPQATLSLEQRTVRMELEVHAAIRTAVPLPGKLPMWSPLSVSVDGNAEAALRRDDDFLWVAVDPGVRQIKVEAMLPNVTEWEWQFLLKPRQVRIKAPEWTVSGVRPDGVPEAQVFFTLKQKGEAGVASFDHQDVQAMALIERNLELGLVWQVRTKVNRLSSLGKAISLRIPLLPGENVLSANAEVSGGMIEVRLGAQEQAFEWESNLTPASNLKLATRKDDAWVEHWRLTASPVWNIAISGLPSVFEPSESNLIPVWQPWPGEVVDLAISRPEAIAGATITVSRAKHEVSLGKRQRVSKLDLIVQCSLGEDFQLELPDHAEVTELKHNNQSIPVRRDRGKLILSLRPGEQRINVTWKTNAAMGLHAKADPVRLPVESANVLTRIEVPADRWVLWTHGPLRGPAVRFWVVLICALLTSFVLGGISLSPLSRFGWLLLALGLTQVPLPAALAVIGWLFFIAWRGSDRFQTLPYWAYNLGQFALVLLTLIALCVLLAVVGEGLLGRPEMFIVGNQSTGSSLRWFLARSDVELPQPGCLTISIWWYRFAMLAWALWLAVSVIKWLRLGWTHFSKGGLSRPLPNPTPATPPALPPAERAQAETHP